MICIIKVPSTGMITRVDFWNSYAVILLHRTWSTLGKKFIAQGFSKKSFYSRVQFVLDGNFWFYKCLVCVPILGNV